MGSVTIRNIPDDALRKLAVRAAQEGLSREEFVRRSLLRAVEVEEWGQEIRRIRERTHPPAGLAEDNVRQDRSEARGGQPVAVFGAPTQQSLLPLAGSGRGLWGKNSARTIRKLREEWSR